MVWQQTYNPVASMFLSTLFAAVPVVVMLVGLGFLHLKAHVAAGAGLLAAIAIAPSSPTACRPRWPARRPSSAASPGCC